MIDGGEEIDRLGVCDSCGDQVTRRWFDDGICIGCRECREPVPDGGRVQDERRQCARCDADAVPGSRFCIGHSEVLPDGGLAPEDFDIDSRNMSMTRSPAVLEERLREGDTSRVSFADVELHESGAVAFTQFDGRKGMLPQWR